MKECCATCKHFEDWRQTELDGTGHCEWDGDDIDMDPEELTCFNWEAKDED